MSSISIRASKLARVAAFAALCLIAWVAEATLAQNPAVKPAPAQLPEASAAAPAPPLDLDGRTERVTLPVSPDQGPPTVDEKVAPPSDLALPSPETLKGPTILQSADSAPPSVPASVAPDPVDDPEKAALAFVEQNEKQAETQLKSLKAEATNLHARLRKVEAGIKRWESLLGALKQSHELAAAAKAPVESPKPFLDKK